MDDIRELAPSGKSVVDYDRTHLTLYAALLDAASMGMTWREAAATILHINVEEPGAETCWRSHLEAANWIVGDGLGPAIEAFGRRPRAIA